MRSVRPIPIALLAGMLACGDDEGAIDRDAAPGPIDAGVTTCESFDSEHEELLNAPTDAVVIVKTPTHPPVGDAGLP